MAIVNIRCIVIDGTVPSDGTLARLPAAQPVTWPIGDAGSINFTVTGTDGAVYDLTDQTLAIVCRRHLDDTEPVFAIDAVNDVPDQGDPEPGTATATLTSDATSEMLAGVTYWYDVRLSATAGGSGMQVVPLSKWTPGPVVAHDGEPPPETPPS